MTREELEREYQLNPEGLTDYIGSKKTAGWSCEVTEYEAEWHGSYSPGTYYDPPEYPEFEGHAVMEVRKDGELALEIGFYGDDYFLNGFNEIMGPEWIENGEGRDIIDALNEFDADPDAYMEYSFATDYEGVVKEMLGGDKWGPRHQHDAYEILSVYDVKTGGEAKVYAEEHIIKRNVSDTQRGASKMITAVQIPYSYIELYPDASGAVIVDDGWTGTSWRIDGGCYMTQDDVVDKICREESFDESERAYVAQAVSDAFDWFESHHHSASVKNATRTFTYAEMQELEDEVIDKPWLNNADRLKNPDVLVSF